MEKKYYEQWVTRVGIISVPFWVVLGLGLQAYLEGPSPVPFLNNGDNALICMIIGAVGVAIEMIVITYLAIKIYLLKR